MSSVRSALVWSFSERYINLIVTLLTTVFLARLLTPAQIGLFSLCATVTIVAGILRDFGVSEYLIQAPELDARRLRSAFSVAIAIAWTIAAVVFLSRHHIAAFYKEPGVAEVLGVLTINFLLLPIGSPAYAVLTRKMEFRKLFIIQTCSNVTQALTGVGLAWQGFGYMSLAWSSVAAIVAQVILITIMQPRSTMILPSFRGAREVLSYGSMFVFSRVIETFSRNAHEFVIARVYGFTSVGVFSRAFGLIEMFYSNVAAAILRVSGPAFAENHRSGEKLHQSYSHATAIMTGIAWPAFSFVAWMSKDIIYILFGSQWGAASHLAQILSIGIIPVYLIAFAPSLLMATGNIKRRLRVVLTYVPIHLVLVLIGSKFGLEGIAWIWALSNLIIFYLFSAAVCSVLKTTFWLLYRPSLPSLGVLSIVCLTQLCCALIAESLTSYAFVRLCIVGAATGVSWLCAIEITSHPIRLEIRRGLAAVVQVWRRRRA